MLWQFAWKPLHSSWIAAIAAASVLLGAFAARHLHIYAFLYSGWLVVALSLLAVCLYKQKRWCVVLAIVAGLLIGYIRGLQTVVQERPVAEFIGQEVVIKGRITEDVVVKSGSDRMTLKLIEINQHKIAGKIWVSLSQRDGVELQRSDVITIKGKLKPGFATYAGVISYGQLISANRTVKGDIGLEIREWFGDGAARVIKPPEVDLALGFLAGEKSSLPDDLLDALQVVGLTHIIVASGYNLTILVRLSRRTLAKASKFAATAGSAGLVGAFILVTGFSPSMSRAGIVTGLSLVAWYYGRNFHPIVLLLLAAAMTVLIDPSYVWGDAGWLLSFSAFAGVLVAAPLLNKYFYGDEKAGIWRQIILETTSAQLLTMPVIIYLFGQYSLIALVANLLILPLIPLVMLLSFIAGLAMNFQLSIIGELIGWLAEKLLQYMIWVVEILASLSWASVDIAASASQAVIMYLVIAVVLWWLKYKTKLRLVNTSVVE